jgi:3-dehydroquinate synthase II
VEVELEGDKISIVLQNAETVRLVSKLEDGKPSSASVTELNTGDEVLVHRQEGARHTGIAVRASLIER